MTYEEFIESKRHRGEDYGIEPNYYPDKLFEYQRHVCEFAIRKGRCAVFLDTGLGKTIIQLTIAVNYHQYTGKPVLIITPLAVAFQFIKESQKFGIDDISYSKDGKHDTRIVVCNYERLDKFNTADFDCVLLDESSILKNFEGATKNTITAFLKKTKYRFLFSATPSPNNHIELGTSSEALGYMGYMDMIGKFFKNNQNNVAKLSQVSKARQGEEYYLKPHAERDFWRWVSSWSISMRKPSDIGYSDEHHVLPELIEQVSIVQNTKPFVIGQQIQAFNMPAISFREIKSEVRNTLQERCEKAVELAAMHETTVHWVNLNDEAKVIGDLNPMAVEIYGAMTIDEKEDILLNFSDGNIKKLITKASITAFGLNWQHCNHCTYFPTYSYEQYYQSIRRFWRFGQKRPVTVDLVMSDGQTEIMKTLQAKKARAIEMFDKLTAEVNSDFKIFKKQFDKQIILPNFLNTQP
jgi:hypothetical protein